VSSSEQVFGEPAFPWAGEELDFEQDSLEPSGVRTPASERGADLALDKGEALGALIASVRRYLDLEPGEELFVVCTLAAAVSKKLEDEEPLWLFLICPPGAGKTEGIRLLDRVADQRVDELTRAGLLSWGAGRKAKRVGLLTRIPAVALVTISDFSTVATMGDREARARMYGMLRVVYDGRVYRGIGGEPGSSGDELEWSGHLTLVAGATPALDTHTSVEAALGERWLTIRLPESSAERARRRARFVVDRSSVPPLRTAAQALAEELVLAARRRIPTSLPRDHVERLVDVATVVATARTGVQFEGQGRGRVPIGLPIPEEPTRLTGQLNRLARCLLALGLEEPAAVELAIRVALDSVPLARMRALQAVADTNDEGATIADVHRGLGRGNRWAAIWELDALDAIGLVHVEGPSREEDPHATRHYKLAAEWRQVYESVASYTSLPSRKENNAGSSPRIRTLDGLEEPNPNGAPARLEGSDERPGEDAARLRKASA
jgi:hypothetical protein